MQQGNVKRRSICSWFENYFFSPIKNTGRTKQWNTQHHNIYKSSLATRVGGTDRQSWFCVRQHTSLLPFWQYTRPSSMWKLPVPIGWWHCTHTKQFMQNVFFIALTTSCFEKQQHRYQSDFCRVHEDQIIVCCDG